jgi:hypothetical protein
MELNQLILERIHTAIFEASADDARVALELLKKVNEEQMEEAEELIHAVESVIVTPKKPLPPAVENVVRDPEVVEMVSDYNKSGINYTVEKGLIDLDTIIETPENELVDKEEKLKDLKDVSAKLLTTDKGMEVVKEVAIEIERLEREVDRPKTTKKRRRRR